jgi:poly(3-hydroxybutyrate) depolymerase
MIVKIVVKRSLSTHRIAILFLVVVLSPWLHTSATASEVKSSSVKSRTAGCAGNIEQAYLYYSPDKKKPNKKEEDLLPAVVLLHGAGDRAENMVSAWKHIAEKERIILLAPELPRDPKFEDAAPRIFRCVVEDARQALAIDAQRVYLFGNSMGGYLAFDGAMFESQYFAAVAVHASRIADDYTGIVARARRKTPIAIYIGDHDQFFSVASVRQTRDLLLESGFPIHYVELANHDHNYYARADEINSDAWKFLKANILPPS